MRKRGGDRRADQAPKRHRTARRWTAQGHPAVNGTKVSGRLSQGSRTGIDQGRARPDGIGAVDGCRAEFSTAEAKSPGIKQVTGEFTTYFPYLPYRNVNIGRAAGVDQRHAARRGDLLLNGVVGERTAANGFTEGYIIEGGKLQGARWGVLSRLPPSTPCSSPD